jgi:hypothetical protein
LPDHSLVTVPQPGMTSGIGRKPVGVEPRVFSSRRNLHMLQSASVPNSLKWDEMGAKISQAWGKTVLVVFGCFKVLKSIKVY